MFFIRPSAKKHVVVLWKQTRVYLIFWLSIDVHRFIFIDLVFLVLVKVLVATLLTRFEIHFSLYCRSRVYQSWSGPSGGCGCLRSSVIICGDVTQFGIFSLLIFNVWCQPTLSTLFWLGGDKSSIFWEIRWMMDLVVHGAVSLLIGDSVDAIISRMLNILLTRSLRPRYYLKVWNLLLFRLWLTHSTIKTTSLGQDNRLFCNVFIFLCLIRSNNIKIFIKFSQALFDRKLAVWFLIREMLKIRLLI
jgi:hypothetical protein